MSRSMAVTEPAGAHPVRQPPRHGARAGSELRAAPSGRDPEAFELPDGGGVVQGLQSPEPGGLLGAALRRG